VTTWYVDLKGESGDLEEVSKRYRSKAISILKKNNRFIMISEHFSLLSSSAEVHSRAVHLLKKINGSMQVVLDDYKPVSVQSVAHIDDRGRLSKTITFTLNIIDVGEKRSKESKMPEKFWPEVADQDRNVAKLLDFFSQELNWINLYRIWEVIQEDQGSKVFEKGWIEKKIVKCFKQTANSFGAIGDASRHGHEKIPSPKSPMKLENAKKYICSVAAKWLGEKTKGVMGEQS